MEISARDTSSFAPLKEAPETVSFSFPDMRAMASLVGSCDHNLIYIEDKVHVGIGARGINVNITGNKANVTIAETVLRDLYRQIECGEEISDGIIDAAIRAAGEPQFREILRSDESNVVPQVYIKTRLKKIIPRSVNQANYMIAMQKEDMVFGLGPAGTGKTYVAVAQAVAELITGRVEKIICSRPAVEAGEHLGFLPGDMKEKVDPYLRPIYDALFDCLPAEQVERRIAAGEIEIAPLAFMRGRTLAKAFIILDEAQNTTPAQMKMALTRFGEGSRMVVCGDPNQTDIPGGPEKTGLFDAMTRLRGIEGVHMTNFTSKDVVRHPLVGRIVDAYEGVNG